jgi:hypothetical protein
MVVRPGDPLEPPQRMVCPWTVRHNTQARFDKRFTPILPAPPPSNVGTQRQVAAPQ